MTNVVLQVGGEIIKKNILKIKIDVAKRKENRSYPHIMNKN